MAGFAGMEPPPGAGRSGLLARLRERIVGFAASRYSREEAEDLAQEVLVVLHEKYAHVDRMEELVPLSLQILRFKTFAMRRKAVRHGEYAQVSVDDCPLAGEGPDPEEKAPPGRSCWRGSWRASPGWGNAAGNCSATSCRGAPSRRSGSSWARNP